MEMEKDASTWSYAAGVTLVILTSFLLKLYIGYRNVLSYWSSRGVLGPKPLFIIGNFHKFAFAPMAMVYDEWYRKFGPIFGVHEGTKPVLMVQDADLIKELFIKNSNVFLDRREAIGGDEYMRSHLFNKRSDEWRIHRRIMSPSFTSGKMKMMFSLMNECYAQLDRELTRVVRVGVEVDAKMLFSKLTASVIARCAFATQVDPYTDEDNVLLKSLHSWFNISRPKMLLASILPKILRKQIMATGDQTGRNYLYKICAEIIRERQEMKAKGLKNQYADLMQLLLDAGEETKDDTADKVLDHEAHHIFEGANEDKMNGSKTGGKKAFTEVELVANVVLFFIAGFETTSTLLQYCSYVLTNEPEVQDTLYSELKKVYDENNGQFDYETISSNAYLDSFICETLRMFPPGNRIERTPNAPFTLPNGVTLTTDDLVSTSIYVLHRDAKYFDKPDTFDMRRFLPENRSKVVPCSYLPFGLGPRNCIGMRFSLLEAKLALANFLMKFKFVRSLRTTSHLQFQPMTLVLTPKQLLVKIEERK